MASAKNSSFKAFALLEIAIALCVLGIINYVGFAAFAKIKAWQQTKTTKSHQEQVMQAVAGYVLMHHKLPCPAASNNGKAQAICTTAETAIGYIPYKTLSIPEELAKDGAHHWMSYAINTSLASAWLLQIDVSPDDKTTNPNRTFCGTSSNNSLELKDAALDNCVTPPDFPAVVIISHGKSGGYYLDNGTTQSCTSSDSEKIANSSRNGTYFTKPLQFKENQHFDDIVFFASRSNLMAKWAQAPCKAH
jgi:hypothetical protein